MLGLLTLFAGIVAATVGLVWLFGAWPLVVAGGVLMVVGLTVDVDALKEPQRAKRSQPAP